MADIGLPGFSDIVMAERSRIQSMVGLMRAKKLGVGAEAISGGSGDETDAFIFQLEEIIGELDALIATYERMPSDFQPG